MARFFRIKNKALRWFAGLLYVILIKYLAKAVVVVVALGIVFIPIGYGVRVMEKKCEVSNSLTSEAMDEASTLFYFIDNDAVITNIAMFISGFCAVLSILIMVTIPLSIGHGLWRLYVKAEEYGDRYFNSIGDKK